MHPSQMSPEALKEFLNRDVRQRRIQERDRRNTSRTKPAQQMTTSTVHDWDSKEPTEEELRSWPAPLPLDLLKSLYQTFKCTNWLVKQTSNMVFYHNPEADPIIDLFSGAYEGFAEDMLVEISRLQSMIDLCTKLIPVVKQNNAMSRGLLDNIESPYFFHDYCINWIEAWKEVGQLQDF